MMHKSELLYKEDGKVLVWCAIFNVRNYCSFVQCVFFDYFLRYILNFYLLRNVFCIKRSSV